MADRAAILVNCKISLTRDGATAWFAELGIPDWGLTIDLLPVEGTTDDEAYECACEWLKVHLHTLHSMVRHLGPGRLSFANPSSPEFTPNANPLSFLMGGEVRPHA